MSEISSVVSVLYDLVVLDTNSLERRNAKNAVVEAAHNINLS